MQTRTYRVNEIFCSPQGEGHRQGEASVFLRFTGCNLRCAMEPGPRSPGGFDCDTEFASGTRMKLDDIVQHVTSFEVPWVVLTGGEPMMQVDQELIDALHAAGLKLQIETNGTQKVPDSIDFITVSPKVAEHALTQLSAHEVKYVRGHGQAIPKTRVKAQHYFVSPAFLGDQLDERAIQWCRELVAANPPWRLSLQMHKIWRVR